MSKERQPRNKHYHKSIYVVTVLKSFLGIQLVIQISASQIFPFLILNSLSHSHFSSTKFCDSFLPASHLRAAPILASLSHPHPYTSALSHHFLVLVLMLTHSDRLSAPPPFHALPPAGYLSLYPDGNLPIFQMPRVSKKLALKAKK